MGGQILQLTINKTDVQVGIMSFNTHKNYLKQVLIWHSYGLGYGNQVQDRGSIKSAVIQSVSREEESKICQETSLLSLLKWNREQCHRNYTLFFFLVLCAFPSKRCLNAFLPPTLGKVEPEVMAIGRTAYAPRLKEQFSQNFPHL